MGLFSKPLHSGVKLGKLPPRKDARTLKMSSFRMQLPVPPSEFDLSHRLPVLDILGNDRLGDCTAAGAGHMHQAWLAYNGVTDWSPTRAETIDFYSGSTGYDPNDPSTDSGGIMLDVLKYWRKSGFAGRQIEYFLEINPKDHIEVIASTYHFGGLYVGVNLPSVAEDQKIWDVPWYGPFGKGAPGSLGGHCIANICAITEKYLYTDTWGINMPMTWDFWREYVDEAYVVLSQDWYGKEGVCPTGMNVNALKTAIGESLQ